MAAKKGVIVVRSGQTEAQTVVFPKRFAENVSAIYASGSQKPVHASGSSGRAQDGDTKSVK